TRGITTPKNILTANQVALIDLEITANHRMDLLQIEVKLDSTLLMHRGHSFLTAEFTGMSRIVAGNKIAIKQPTDRHGPRELGAGRACNLKRHTVQHTMAHRVTKEAVLPWQLPDIALDNAFLDCWHTLALRPAARHPHSRIGQIDAVRLESHVM